jgi:hypothetical protein
MSILTALAIMRVVVPWNPYSPNSRRAADNILALLESGFFWLFQGGMACDD